MKLLIIGDPKGTHSLYAMSKYAPENIWVWENDSRHIYTIKQICDRINVITDLQELVDKNMKFDVIIGNPPYGSGANLAIKFVNKSAEMSDDIFMVLPRSFEKDSVQNKIRLDLELIESVVLPENTFPNGIRAVRQRWVKTNTHRKKVEKPRTHEDFEFLKYENRFKANVFIGEYGCGPSGRVKTENFTHYAKGHYFILAKDQSVIDRLVSLEPKFRAVAADCNGRYHISKGELVEIYINDKNEHKDLVPLEELSQAPSTTLSDAL